MKAVRVFSALLACAILSSSIVANACTTQVESVNCTDKNIANLLLTCKSSSEERDCACALENPLRTEEGWYKLCRTRMNLKSRKKKVIKRQIRIPSDHCGTIQPPRPGKASCVLSPTAITCTGECDRGFRFNNGEKKLSYSCSYSERIWKPDALYPPCEPECIPPCENGGNCTAPNFCACTNEYRGDFCQYALKLCDLSKTQQASSWSCNHTRSATTCDVSCSPPGSSSDDARRHVCDVDGKWAPHLPPCVQVVQCVDPGDIDSGSRFLSSSEGFAVGSTITFECDDGHSLSGTASIECLADGQWSEEKPSCVPNPVEITEESCSKPHAPRNSIVHVTFPQQRPLQTFFSSELPLLQRLYLTLNSNLSSDSNADFSSLPEGLFTVGSRVQYKCKSRFYKLYGSEYQTCLASGRWSGYQPACVPECGKSDSPKTPFVVNGLRSQVGQWPWMVALERSGQLVCGGALVSETWVLTAAHCVTKRMSSARVDKRSLVVHLGKYHRRTRSDDEYVQVRRVKQIVVQSEYDFVHYDGDIALIQLEREVELTTRVRPVCLPTEITTRENLRDGQKGIVLGWGLTENGSFSDTLREAELPVVSHEKCEQAYREGLRSVTVTGSMFCAGHEEGVSDACTGDSGGPLMFPSSVSDHQGSRWYLEGIVSWGSESGCGQAKRYSGFTKVGRFVPWINMFI